MDIGNQSRYYAYQTCNTTVEEIRNQGNDETYIEIVFSSPQTFRFYNNRDWCLEDVLHIAYCVNDGTLWYGTEEKSLEYRAGYVSEEYPYSVDEEMLNEIREVMN